MTCPQCEKPTSRLTVYEHGSACANCLGKSESGGPKLDGSVTRSSFRVRDQQRTNEGDFITPHVFDKVQKKAVPNPDFIEKYPNQVKNYFTKKDLKQAGYSKADKIGK